MKTTWDSAMRRLFLALLLAVAGVWAGPALAQDEEDPPTASIDIEDVLPDGHALMSLNNWSPLARVEMATEDGAQRTLEYVLLQLRGDPVDERPYDRFGAAQKQHIYEIGIIFEGGNPEEDWGTLDEFDRVGFVMDADGFPLADVDVLAPDPFGGSFTSNANNGFYAMNFIGTGTADDPEFPVHLNMNGYGSQVAFFICVRTSALWHNGLTLAYDVPGIRLVDPDGAFPGQYDDEGVFTPDDGYGPDFYGEEPAFGLEIETAYGSSFGVFDITGHLYNDIDTFYANTWTWPMRNYTPTPEYVRPRWDSSATAIESRFGEFFELRRLFALETWLPVVGINAHATDTSVFEVGERRGFNPLTNAEPRGDVRTNEDFGPFGGVPVFPVSPPFIVELNVVMTDVGADPLGAPGNGGFDPRSGLDPMWYKPLMTGGSIVQNRAELEDHVFNGIWLWHDTNNDFNFNPPTPEGGVGVTINDAPIMPMPYYIDDSIERTVFGIPELTGPSPDLFYQHVAFPPGGGDPWWKIRLGLSEARIPGGGRIEPEPDGGTVGDGGRYTAMYPDYFITLRPDSGYADVSGNPGDGVGLTYGADTRVFIEPRDLTDPFKGGLLLTNQFPLEWLQRGDDWRNHPGWNPGGWVEPWWPQRTLNQNSMKIVKSGVEVHDLVMTYESSNTEFSRYTTRQLDLAFTGGSWPGVPVHGATTAFDRWMDVNQAIQAQFFEGYAQYVREWRLMGVGIPDTDNARKPQRPYESVPFMTPVDSGVAPPYNPRSVFYPSPPQPPTMPRYTTWPHFLTNTPLDPGEYPRESDWPDTEVQARKLKQRIDGASLPTAMLGFNLVGTNDPRVNQFAQTHLDIMTVALWSPDFNGDGLPDFTPADLEPLDPDGLSASSGVGLYIDSDQNGLFSPASAGGGDTQIEVVGLGWKAQPEYVDINGDQAPDDLNGDGVINQLDKAWVLQFRMSTPWPLPIGDDNTGGGAPGTLDSTNAGDDMFLVVRTSKTISRFARFKAIVPAWLPERQGAINQVGGFQYLPRQVNSLGAYDITHPEEIAMQGFYEHSLIETNVPVEVNNLTGLGQQLPSNGSPVELLGIDASTNRPSSVRLLSGATGTPGAGTFIPTGVSMTAGAYVGKWLVDSEYRGYLITGNTATTLTLAGGTPKSGSWYIVKDPTFLEQLVVEFYNETATGLPFRLTEHLLPMNINPDLSGVALYRDNDNHPLNQNGIFDPGIDLPVWTDYAPFVTGQPGEPDTQVMFVFSSPGTDDIPTFNTGENYVGRNFPAPYNRQVVPDSFGSTANHPDRGNDFFVVVRASGANAERVTFRAAIVGWGPNTPTLPDPDTFPPPPWATRSGEFDLFSEFPWGSRALGFITFFEEDGSGRIPQYDPNDTSGYNWVRTGSNKRLQTNVVTIDTPVVKPLDVTITSVTPTALPSPTPTGGTTIVITGTNFGAAPLVTLNGVTLTVLSSSNTVITARITEGTVLTEPLLLQVRNTENNRSATFTGLTVTTEEDIANSPTITQVSPARGGSGVFPVTIFGTKFEDPAVFFDNVAMPVQEWGPTRIVVNFPPGGLPRTGAIDVVVRNTTSGLSATALGGFVYDNAPAGACFIATAAYGTVFEGELDTFRAFRDGVLLKSAAGAALVDVYYTVSPSAADVVGQSPVLSALARGVLTPLAWAMREPVLLALPLMLSALGLLARRRVVVCRIDRKNK